jgi:hypothetical protein
VVKAQAGKSMGSGNFILLSDKDRKYAQQAAKKAKKAKKR